MDAKQTLLRSAFLLALTLSLPAPAEENPAPAEQPTAAGTAENQEASGPLYELRYKFSAGETLRWKVVHLATTETTVRGHAQNSKSHAVSTKLWRVVKADAEAGITFTHSVDNVNMWQKLSDRPEIHYHSDRDSQPPPEYEHVAKTLRRPLTTVTMRANGEILKREGDSPNFGVGDIVMLLPPKPVRAGSRWYEPSELQVRLPNEPLKRIKIRKLYTLEKVQTGVATISVKTEVLTPVDDPRVRAQLVQQLTNGTIKFDVDAGRLLSKQIDWDETVIGFSGADSMIKYLGRITEELLPATAITSETASSPTAAPVDTPPSARAARPDTSASQPR